MKKLSEKIGEDRLEIIVAVFLGIVALLTAWATWISGLHGGNQSTNYTTSNNVASEGNSLYNEAAQTLMQDMLLWNDISDLQTEVLYNETSGDEDALEIAAYKLFYKCYDNLDTSMICDKIDWDYDAAYEGQDDPVLFIVNWLEDENATSSPFYDDEFVESYFDEANEVLAEADEYLEQGKLDNAHGDAYNLVTVIYSLVLFLLGIVGIFKSLPNRFLLVIIALVAFIFATIYMITIPLPTGFSFASFFTRH